MVTVPRHRATKLVTAGISLVLVALFLVLPPGGYLSSKAVLVAHHPRPAAAVTQAVSEPAMTHQQDGHGQQAPLLPPITVVTCSDTHGLHSKLRLPPGDLLVFAGDAGLDDQFDIDRFEAWLGSLEHKHKVVVMGNMDSRAALGAGVGPRSRRSVHAAAAAASASSAAGQGGPGGRTCISLQNATVVCDEVVTVAGYRVLGSPWTPAFYGQWQLEGEDAARRHWSRLLPPEARVDILVTHGPPHGYGDATKGRHVGDRALLEAVQALEVPPLLWVCGHIHEAFGAHSVPHPRAPAGRILLVNAAAAYFLGQQGERGAAPRAVALPDAVELPVQEAMA